MCTVENVANSNTFNMLFARKFFWKKGV